MVLARILPITPALLALVLSVCLSGCLGVPTEPRSAVILEQPWGIAGGQSREEAQRLVQMVEHVLPAYRDLEGFVERPLRAHITGSLGHARLAGITVEPLVGGAWLAVDRDSQDFELALAHELAHFYFEEQQARFPSIIEEGMCELLSDLAYDASDLFRRRLMLAGVAYLDHLEFRVKDPRGKLSVESLRANAPDIEAALAMDWAELFGADRATAVACYGLGYLLVRRIGWDGILSLLRRADRGQHAMVPNAWIMEQAGLRPPYDLDLRRILVQELGLEELERESTH